MLLNCDIGEQGIEHSVDLQLLEHLDIANIACGGHAGSEESARSFYTLARKSSVMPTLHLSYPDFENFGRVSLDISVSDLLVSLTEQREVLPEVSAVKFHGALYNDCATNEDLARQIVGWLRKEEVSKILAPPDSYLADLASASGIAVLAEGFLDRRYVFLPHSRQLLLMQRREANACIISVQDAMAQAERIIAHESVEAHVADSDQRITDKTTSVSLEVQTLCIHSDSEIALPLAKAYSEFKRSLEQ